MISRSASASSSARQASRLPLHWVLIAWLLLAAVSVGASWGSIANFDAQDPDDYMRLLQARDFLNGQDWFDSHQYRLSPPAGADMHWVRLVDLPIAFCLLLFAQVLPDRLAETAAMTAVPLITLLVALLMLRGLTARLGGSLAAQRLALLLLPAFPLAFFNFQPMRVDHHAWQAVAALGMVLLALARTHRAAFLCGCLGALVLLISLEAIAMCGLIGAVLAVRYWLDGERHHEAYLWGLALAAPVLFALFRPLPEFTLAMCDQPGWPHMLAFASAALLASGSRFWPGQARRSGRLLGLLPVGLAGAASLFVPLGWCVVAPLQLDPFLQSHWQAMVPEAAPVFRQVGSVAVMTIMTLAIAGVAGVLAWRWSDDPAARRRLAEYTVIAVGAGLYSLLVMRAGLSAQLLTIPLAALAIARSWPRLSQISFMPLRLVGRIALIGVALPLFATAAVKPLDRASGTSFVEIPAGAVSEDCQMDRLAALPPAHMFLSLERSPELLARTRHTAIMSGYHRNQQKMIDVFKGFGAPLDEAEAVIRAHRADYVVVCLAAADFWTASRMSSDGIAARIAGHRPLPAWLEPVPGFDQGALTVYKVRK